VFERQPLASSIGLIQNIVGQVTTMPILTNVLIEAEGDHARISGTDLESFGQVKRSDRRIAA